MRSSALLLALSLPPLGCVGEATSTATTDADVVVIVEDVSYEPEVIEVLSGRTVRLELRNKGGMAHDLVLAAGWETGHVQPRRFAMATLAAQPTARS